MGLKHVGEGNLPANSSLTVGRTFATAMTCLTHTCIVFLIFYGKAKLSTTAFLNNLYHDYKTEGRVQNKSTLLWEDIRVSLLGSTICIADWSYSRRSRNKLLKDPRATGSRCRSQAEMGLCYIDTTVGSSCQLVAQTRLYSIWHYMNLIIWCRKPWQKKVWKIDDQFVKSMSTEILRSAKVLEMLRAFERLIAR